MNIRIVEEVWMNDQSIRREVEVTDIAESASPQELSCFIADVVERVAKVIDAQEESK